MSDDVLFSPLAPDQFIRVLARIGGWKPQRRVKRGQIWQVGQHRLMCGDARDAGDMARLMDGAKAATSPLGKLVFENGTLYRTTELGGESDMGTVFSVNPSNRKARLLGSLGGTLGDFPIGGLAYDGTSFWGTTQNLGTVFKFTVGH